MPTSSIEQKRSIRKKIERRIALIRDGGAKRFTSAEISKVCNLKSSVVAGVIIQDYVERFNLRKVDFGIYEFA